MHVGARAMSELLQQLDDVRADTTDGAAWDLTARRRFAGERTDGLSREMIRRELASHLDALAAALEYDRPDLFERHVAWAARVAVARGAKPAALAESVEVLVQHLHERLSPQAGEHALRVVAAGLRSLETQAMPPPLAAEAAEDGRPEVARLTEALLRGDDAEAEDVLLTCLEIEEHDIARLGDRLLRPAMAEVGRLWQEGRITVAGEHLAATTVQVVLARRLGRRPAMSGARKILLACVEGNEHALGLWILADALKTAGWSAQHLGASVPAWGLVSHARSWRPDVVALSLAMPGDFLRAEPTVRALREGLGPRPPRVLLGGLAVQEFPELAARVGADLWSTSAADALAKLDAIARASA